MTKTKKSDHPIWDSLADRWAEVQAVQAQEVAR